MFNNAVDIFGQKNDVSRLLNGVFKYYFYY